MALGGPVPRDNLSLWCLSYSSSQLPQELSRLISGTASQVFLVVVHKEAKMDVMNPNNPA